jgi:hypothetical protein
MTGRAERVAVEKGVKYEQCHLTEEDLPPRRMRSYSVAA